MNCVRSEMNVVGAAVAYRYPVKAGIDRNPGDDYVLMHAMHACVKACMHEFAVKMDGQKCMLTHAYIQYWYAFCIENCAMLRISMIWCRLRDYVDDHRACKY